MAVDVRVKRIYEDAGPDDGYRVLVDRLWPRGVSREEARLDEWANELAPSHDLRRWFAHDPEKFEAFRARYRDELAGQGDGLRALHSRAATTPVTLVYAARDDEHNHAIVLADAVRRV